MLTPEEKYYARKLFQLEVYKRNGQAFEDFFTTIMRFHNTEFAPVKPQGKFGDRKNDGFIKSLGKYYQVYSPENPTNSEYEAIKKLETDFSGLYQYWNSQVVPIKEFNYVLNDKYKGGYPSLHETLQSIETTHTGITCNPFLSSNLEDVFLSLRKDQIMDLVGPILTPESIQIFEPSVMSEAITYILTIEKPYQPETIPERPDFDEKLVFNNLSSHVAGLLKYGSFQEGTLKDYFKLNSNFLKENLRNTFNQLYKDSLSEITDSPEKGDLVFYSILKQVSPSKQYYHQNAAIILMSYYFGYCDIFEEPKRQ